MASEKLMTPLEILEYLGVLQKTLGDIWSSFEYLWRPENSLEDHKRPFIPKMT